MTKRIDDHIRMVLNATQPFAAPNPPSMVLQSHLHQDMPTLWRFPLLLIMILACIHRSVRARQ